MPDHDPVSAISEAEATGRTAEIFAEIREVMQIPLVTSIWRTLEAIEGGLEAAWGAARPIYESGQPDALLAQLRKEIELPTPEPIPADALNSVNLDGKDCESISSILAAYNRSNSLNLIALTALVRKSSSIQLRSVDRPEVKWPTLPPLLSKAEIDPGNWSLLETTIALGVNLPTTALPTLWRHLIYWPGFVDLMLEHYKPLHQSGVLFKMVQEVTTFVEKHAPEMSHFRDGSADIPEEALQMIEDYVGEPPSVSRMASLGTSVAQWLESSDWNKVRSF